MARAQLSKEQMAATVAAKPESVYQLTIRWPGAPPSRAQLTSLLNKLFPKGFTMSLDRSGEVGVVTFLGAEAAARLADCPSLTWARNNVGQIEIRDLKNLASGAG